MSIGNKCPVIRLICRWPLGLIVLLFSFYASTSMARESTPLTDQWSFQKGDETNAASPDFADNNWQKVSLPHCWGWEEAQITNTYYRGPGWYRRKLVLQPETGRR